jgi:hypothetical protein
MGASAQPRRAQPRRGLIPTAARRDDALVAGLSALAAVNIGLAIVMAAAPHAFFTAIGPFGARNDHYIRDVATFEAALGVGLAVAVRRPSWRMPVLAVTAVQYGLHSVNHLIDIASAHPPWTGYLDFFSLSAATALLLWLLALARTQARIPTPRLQGDLR